jgi:hypothetical protein
MEHQSPHFVGSSSDEEDACSLAETRAETTAEAEVDNDEGDENESFPVQRRLFLHGTASSLMLSRVHDVRELEIIVEGLGNALSKLNEMRDILDRAGALHASLSRRLGDDRRAAEAAIVKHGFAAQNTVVPPFSSALTSVTSMFMIDMDSEQ